MVLEFSDVSCARWCMQHVSGSFDSPNSHMKWLQDLQWSTADWLIFFLTDWHWHEILQCDGNIGKAVLMAGWCNNGNLGWTWLALFETFLPKWWKILKSSTLQSCLRIGPPSSRTITAPWMVCLKFLYAEKQASLYYQPGTSSLCLKQITSNQHTFAICWSSRKGVVWWSLKKWPSYQKLGKLI